MAILTSRVSELPPPVWEHLKQSIVKGRVNGRDLALLRCWLADKQTGFEVPDGDWYRPFGSFYLCGRGPHPLTLLSSRMKPWGVRIGSIAPIILNFNGYADLSKSAAEIASSKFPGFVLVAHDTFTYLAYPSVIPKNMSTIGKSAGLSLAEVQASYVTNQLGYTKKSQLIAAVKGAIQAGTAWKNALMGALAETEFGDLEDGDVLANMYEDHESKGVFTLNDDDNDSDDLGDFTALSVQDFF